MSMATIASGKHWTAANLQTIPRDRNRYEIIDGELLVTPAPSINHQILAAEFWQVLRTYLATHGTGYAVFAPADVQISNDTVVEPDIFVVPLINGKIPRDWRSAPRLLLAIEILSPGTARVDRTLKRRRYQTEGVPEYWIIDGRARAVERWRPTDSEPEILTDRLEWHPDPAAPPLLLDLPGLFAEAAEMFPD